MGQPDWRALSVPLEKRLMYTVQDGRLYLTWRITFNTHNEVGDDFLVWVNARNCTHVVAAAPAKMWQWVPSLEAYKMEQKRLFKEERGIDIAL
jgi:hypothetical protein